MMDDYEWLRQRKRNQRQEERNEEGIDDKLEDGFSLLQDDDDLSDERKGAEHHSSKAEANFERRKRTEL